MVIRDRYNAAHFLVLLFSNEIFFEDFAINLLEAFDFYSRMWVLVLDFCSNSEPVDFWQILLFLYDVINKSLSTIFIICEL